MAKKKPGRAFRSGPVGPTEVERIQRLRSSVMAEFPPDPNRSRPSKHGIAAQIKASRESQGLTWYDVADKAKIDDPAIIRDIEFDRDAKLSDIEAVAQALGLRLALVDSPA